MDDTRGATGADAGQDAAGTAGAAIPLSPEARAELDAATERILQDEQAAQMLQVASEEIGTKTDPASDEPRRSFAGE